MVYGFNLYLNTNDNWLLNIIFWMYYKILKFYIIKTKVTTSLHKTALCLISLTSIDDSIVILNHPIQ